jgi:hypothetical protein
MHRLALLVALFAVASPHAPSVPFRVALFATKRGNWRVTARRGTRRLWTDSAASPFALVDDPRDQVVYPTWDDRRGFELRFRRRGGRRSGSIGYATAFPATHPCAGANDLLFLLPGAQPGVMIEQSRNWREILDDTAVVDLDLSRRRTRWKKSALHVGFPIWANDRVFVTFRFRLSRTKRGAHPHVTPWIEERTIRDARLVWQRRLRRYPVGIRSFRSGGKGVLTIDIGTSHRLPLQGVPGILLYQRSGTIKVPILAGKTTAPATRIVHGPNLR